MKNYMIAAFPVRLNNGMWFESVSGRRLRGKAAERGELVYWAGESATRNRMLRQKAHGKLREEIFTYTIELKSKRLEFEVWCADSMGKNGLFWNRRLAANFYKNKAPLLSEGSPGELRYWLNQGASRLDPALVQRDENALPICEVFARIWGCNDHAFFSENPLRLLKMWLDGNLEAELRSYQLSTARTDTRGTIQTKASILNDYQYGVEVEFTGISRTKAAQIVAHALQGRCRAVWAHYEITDLNERVWLIKDDESIRPAGYGKCCPDEYRCELSSPVFSSSANMQELEAVLTALRKAGAKCNETTGIHVHIGGQFSIWQLETLTRVICDKDALIKRAVRMFKSRSVFCGEMSKFTAKKLLDRELGRYTGDPTADPDFSRYRTINLLSYMEGKGIELRCFNASLNGKLVRSYVVFSLGICSQVVSDHTYHRPRRGDDLSVMKNWLSHMALAEDEACELLCLLQRNLLKEHRDSTKKRIASVARF